jgi:hypothetical protein
MLNLSPNSAWTSAAGTEKGGPWVLDWSYSTYPRPHTTPGGDAQLRSTDRAEEQGSSKGVGWGRGGGSRAHAPTVTSRMRASSSKRASMVAAYFLRSLGLMAIREATSQDALNCRTGRV